MRSSMGLREAKPSSVPCQWVMPTSPQLPAQQHDLARHLAGEVEQADFEVLDLHAGCGNFGHRVFDALDGALALRLAARGLHHVDEEATA
jgi:hypothetical protein